MLGNGNILLKGSGTTISVVGTLKGEPSVSRAYVCRKENGKVQHT